MLRLRTMGGSVSVDERNFPFVDANGDLVRENLGLPGYRGPINDFLSVYGFFPSRCMPDDWNTNLGALVAAFATVDGTVVGSPFEVGLERSVVVPAGATRLQLGVNDSFFGDNSGGFDVDVVRVPRDPGLTQDDPILPIVPTPEMFVFPRPVTRRWYDPPTTGGFLYELEGDGVFVEVGAPLGFDDLRIVVGGVTLDQDFDGGEFFRFGQGVAKFSILGIEPLLDPDDPGFASAFPTFLDFSGSPTALRMSAIATVSNVPAPTNVALLGTLLAAVVVMRRGQR